MVSILELNNSTVHEVFYSSKNRNDASNDFLNLKIDLWLSYGDEFRIFTLQRKTSVLFKVVSYSYVFLL